MKAPLPQTAISRAALLLVAAGHWAAPGSTARAQEEAPAPRYAADEAPRIDEKLGETIPLDLEFTSDAGETVTLRDLIDKPTILTLIYLRCESICTPLLHEVAGVLDKIDLEPGRDYDLVTVSFDVTDKPDTARRAKTNLLKLVKRPIAPESWHFLTGGEQAIAQLTDAVGFRFKREKQDFTHAGTVIFLSPEGKIVRYLPGLRLLGPDVKMALIDAAEGRARSFMARLQRLCYAYDPEGRTYVFKVNRIVLAVSLVIVLSFLGFLLFRRPGRVEGTEGSR